MRPALVWRIVAALGCAMIFESYPTGYATEPSPGGYTLSQIVQLALRHNPMMNGAEAVLEQSQSQRVTAGAYLNPTITGSAGRGSIRDPNTGVSITERTITVEQPLEWLGKRTARQRAADAGVAGALAGMDETKVLVMTEVKGAFFQLLLAQQDAQLARENLKTVEDLVKLVSARVSTREAPKFELVKATVELQKTRKDLARADNALLVARAKLNTVTGKALGESFAIQGEFETARAGLELHILIEQALDRHPALRRQQKAVEQAEFTIEQERASRMPNVAVIGQYHREAGDESITAGLSVPLPLWYRRQGEIGTAMGAHRRAQAERARVQQELEQTITQHFQEVRTAQEQMQVFEQGLLYQAKEAFDIAQFSFRHGVASLLEVIDAQRVYRQTLLEYAQARADHSIALARLERAVGGLP
ncbi:TolC family protein [Nitrospira defluvii]|uniref:Heavy metal RND efflux outer membrane protein, CzcC family n=1 Tax=Nitrospira defluvii TaxID=330214 RepID=A0ABN7M0C5_9BACT|nr:TolC family protein [Nitrospira defluvii]CAE6771324.1 Heavy metal RND efflux outer membrane protein, CzcC family [Nitrospira defluvii]